MSSAHSLVVLNVLLVVILYNADLDFPLRLPSSHICAVAVETSERYREPDVTEKEFISFLVMPVDSLYCF